MNRNLEAALTFAAVAAVAAAAAVTLIVPRPVAAAAVGDITIDPTPFVSTATREAVRAELQQDSQYARDNEWVLQGNAAAPFKSSVSRGEVRDGYRAARGEVQALTGEDSGSVYLKVQPLKNPTRVMGAAAQ